MRRRVDVAALLEPRVPGDPDPGELRDLLAPEPRRTPPAVRRQPDLLGRHPLATAAQEGGQLLATQTVGALCCTGCSAGCGSADRGVSGGHDYHDGAPGTLLPVGGSTRIT